jgi:hypothetical protein
MPAVLIRPRHLSNICAHIHPSSNTRCPGVNSGTLALAKVQFRIIRITTTHTSLSHNITLITSIIVIILMV